ncbi:MAG: histidinol-phosphatase [Alphaproteobacteria bacterium]|nr:histidinol-phosphatase [Alphaproteobacteria bacterium]
MTPQQSSEFLAFAHRLADAAAWITLPLFRTQLDVVDKGDRERDYSAVTRADREAEQAIRALIRATHPDHGVIGEEHGAERADADLTWVIDPIDGTKAFITGFPTWGTLIALNERGRPVLGIVDQPYTRERFVGGPDGAFLNGRRLRTRACPDLSTARLGMTTVNMFTPGPERAAFEAVRDRAALVRSGGDCYSYCMVAHGLLDVVIEGDLAPWDIQGCMPLIEGAGGAVTDWRGGSAAGGGLVLACGDPALHARILPMLRGGLSSA